MTFFFKKRIVPLNLKRLIKSKISFLGKPKSLIDHKANKKEIKKRRRKI